MKTRSLLSERLASTCRMAALLVFPACFLVCSHAMPNIKM